MPPLMGWLSGGRRPRLLRADPPLTAPPLPAPLPAGQGQPALPEPLCERRSSLGRPVPPAGRLARPTSTALVAAAPPLPAAPRRGRDPAPSRLRYRLQRLWLTPWVRSALRLGLPLALMGAAVGYAWAATPLPSHLTGLASALRAEIAARPEFQLTELRVLGLGPGPTADVRAALDLRLPVSSLDTELDALRQRAAAVEGVHRVRVRIAPGGIIEVRAAERVPAVVWRQAEGLTLLDRTGARVRPVATRAGRMDLPLIVGAGAEARVDEALRLFAVAAPIAGRIRGLVRVGERRWDLVLDRNQTIRLPETGTVAALSDAVARHTDEGLLDLDVVLVDLRDARRPILRMSHAATETLKARRAGLDLVGDRVTAGLGPIRPRPRSLSRSLSRRLLGQGVRQ